MSEHNKTTEYLAESYQTGSTRPPKSYGGIIAFLLILVIFLSGIVSALSIMNIHLFRAVNDRNTQDISLLARCVPGEHPVDDADHADSQACLGITGQEITPFYQRYYQVPQGIYVVSVESTSNCYTQGLRAGDILTHFNGTQISGSQGLRELLKLANPGDHAQLNVYRRGDVHQITIIIDALE